MRPAWEEVPNQTTRYCCKVEGICGSTPLGIVVAWRDRQSQRSPQNHYNRTIPQRMPNHAVLRLPDNLPRNGACPCHTTTRTRAFMNLSLAKLNPLCGSIGSRIWRLKRFIRRTSWLRWDVTFTSWRKRAGCHHNGKSRSSLRAQRFMGELWTVPAPSRGSCST